MATAEINIEQSGTPGARDGEPEAVSVDRLWARRCALPVIALAAAVPSLAASVSAGFMSDDWTIWLDLERRSFLESLRFVGFEQPGRPLAGFYYVLLYEVIGDRSWLHGILLGGINAALVVSAWLAGRRFLPQQVLYPALVVMALAPNHAMTRIWFVAGYYPLALTLVLVGLWCLALGMWRRCAALLVVAALLYEGVLGFGLGAVALWALRDIRRRGPRAIGILAPTAGALALVYLYSSKRGGTIPFNRADTVLSAQLGVGLWGSPLLAYVGGGAVLLGVAWAAARQLPSFRADAPEPSAVLLGAALAAAGALPFVVTGAPFGTTGLFDRNNLAPSIGVALVGGGLWSALRRWKVGAAIAIATGTLAVFAAGQVTDLRNWSSAFQRGGDIVDRLAASEVDDSAPILVVPQQYSGETGMADFVYDGDLIGALRHRHGGDWSRVRLINGAFCEEPAAEGVHQVVDWRSGAVRRLPGAVVHRRCEDLLRG